MQSLFMLFFVTHLGSVVGHPSRLLEIALERELNFLTVECIYSWMSLVLPPWNRVCLSMLIWQMEFNKRLVKEGKGC